MALVDGRLIGFRVLIAEDDYLLSSMLSDLIMLSGGTVVGPLGREKEALAKIDHESVDCAIVDGPCFPLIEILMGRGIPVIIATGYPISSIPERLRHLPIFGKPCDLEQLSKCVADCCRAKAIKPRGPAPQA